MDFFDKIPINQVLEYKLQNGPVKLISANSLGVTIEQAAKILQQNNIISMPVFDDRTDEPVGIVDVIEIMKYTTFRDYFTERPSKNAKQTPMQDLEFEELLFSIGNVGEIVENSSRAARLHIFLKSDSMSLVMKALSKSDASHKVLIRSMVEPPTEQMTNRFTYQLLGQTDIVKYLNHQMQSHELPESITSIFHKSIEELGLVNQSISAVITASCSMTAIECFEKMTLEQVSAVAIVDEKNHVIANLSASDLRGITSSKLKLLKLPVCDFLKQVHGRNPTTPVCCPTNALLKDVLNQILEAKVHRSWVLNSNNQPISVVSMSDIIACAIGTQKHIAKLEFQHQSAMMNTAL